MLNFRVKSDSTRWFFKNFRFYPVNIRLFRYTPVLVRFYPVISKKVFRYCPVKFHLFRYNPVLSKSFRYAPVQQQIPGATTFIPIRPGNFKYIPIRPGDFKYIPIHPGDSLSQIQNNLNRTFVNRAEWGGYAHLRTEMAVRYGAKTVGTCGELVTLLYNCGINCRPFILSCGYPSICVVLFEGLV